MKKLLLFKKMIIIVLLVGISSAGWAQVLLYEPFNYPTPAYIGGNTAIPSASNNWTTHSGGGGTIDITAGNLTYPGLASSTGNKVYFFSNANSTSRDVNRPITSTATKLYYSLLVSLIDTVQLRAAGDYFLSFGGTAGSAVTLLGARLGAKLAPTPALNTFRFIIENNSGTGASFTDNGLDLTIGTTYLVVVKFDISVSPTVATMWVNPVTLGGATEAVGGISNSSAVPSTAFPGFASICLRNSGTTPKANIDEIRVGATWADVTPISNVGLSNKVQDLRQTAVYPNPASTFFNVKAPEGKYLVSVNNSIGKLVKTAELNSTGKIEIPDLTSGLYFVTVENLNTNHKEVHKLMIR